MVKVKICGITRRADLEAAVDLEADFAGVIFVPSSPRYVNPERASGLFKNLDKKNTRLVGVFQDPDFLTVNFCMENFPLDFLQFHGKETPDFCNQFNYPYIKTFTLDETARIFDYSTSHILLDSARGGQRGGTGLLLNWEKVSGMDFGDKNVWMAGGLSPDNIERCLESYRPYAVDVSSGVEERPGIKDPLRIKRMIKKVRKF
jgi:phosphoribosylanthranilate isomerase